MLYSMQWIYDTAYVSLPITNSNSNSNSSICTAPPIISPMAHSIVSRRSVLSWTEMSLGDAWMLLSMSTWECGSLCSSPYPLCEVVNSWNTSSCGLLRMWQPMFKSILTVWSCELSPYPLCAVVNSWPDTESSCGLLSMWQPTFKSILTVWSCELTPYQLCAVVNSWHTE